MDIYHIVIWFFLCSLLGYLLECVVLSAEYKTPVLNRGFGHGPFCIIYGFGALGASTRGSSAWRAVLAGVFLALFIMDF